jgi:N utilization substance protein B
MTPVELALLRQAVFELKDRLDVPFKVVISEAVALAKKFGATDGHKYINGVLDRAAASLRAAEFQAG